MNNKQVKLVVDPDGSINPNRDEPGMPDAHIRWWVGEETVRIDGELTIDELRAIANHMEKFGVQNDQNT